jgi:hypothetical protein
LTESIIEEHVKRIFVAKKRAYELKARAQRQARTRQRIVEATMELHKEVGPARTTVAEVARRAGVHRLRETEPMAEKVQRDRWTVPELNTLMERTADARLAQLTDALAKGFRARGRRGDRQRALIRLALDFWTWHRLNREGFDDAAAAELMTDAVSAAGTAIRASH